MSGAASLDGAYAACLSIAHAHYENFPVASRLLPARLRPHVAAVYAFARVADDFADEPGRSDRERLELLDGWHRCLLACADGNPDLVERPRHPSVPSVPSVAPVPSVTPVAAAGVDTGAIFAALADTIQRFSLPLPLFEDLLSAFKQDVVTSRYDAWSDVLDYCRRSANPVGRLVLRLALWRPGRPFRDERLDRQSDAVCTALQLANFWQDFGVDWSRGRLYVPAEEWRAAGADPSTIGTGPLDESWRRVLAAAVARTRVLFDEGRPVSAAVGGRLGWELAATWHGGMRVLERLEASGYDPVTARPSLGATDAMVIGWRTVRERIQRG
ncbi:MAG: squalene synthase HpnC [Vicinamibacterales bacterium]